MNTTTALDTTINNDINDISNHIRKNVFTNINDDPIHLRDKTLSFTDITRLASAKVEVELC